MARRIAKSIPKFPAIDQGAIDLAEDHLLAVIYEEIAQQRDVFETYADFARAAFGDVNNPNDKWKRIRKREKRLSFSDVYRIALALGVEATSLVAVAIANARMGKSLPVPPAIAEK